MKEPRTKAENNFSLVQISAKLGQCYKTRWFSLKIYSTKMEANVPNLCGLNRHTGLGWALHCCCRSTLNVGAIALQLLMPKVLC